MARATLFENGKCSSVLARREPCEWELLFLIDGTVCDGVWLGIESHKKEILHTHINPYGWTFKIKIVNNDDVLLPPTATILEKIPPSN